MTALISSRPDGPDPSDLGLPGEHQGGSEIEFVSLDDILAIDRKRPADPFRVQQLAESIAEVGMLHPPMVRPHPDGQGYILVAGLHRLAAARRLGWTHLPVTVRALDDLRARLAEIDENLMQHRPTILQESLWMAERKSVYEALHPETRHGGDCGNQHTGGRARQTDNLTFCLDTARRAGQSERTVRRRVFLGERLAPLAGRLLGTPIADDQAQLCRLVGIVDRSPELTQAVVDRIAGGQATKVQEALRQAQQVRQLHLADQFAVQVPRLTDRYRLLCVDLTAPDRAQWEVEPASVAAIITARPFSHRDVSLYGVLAQRAAVWLKPGGSLIVPVRQTDLPQAMHLTTPHLTYHWTLAYLLSSGQSSTPQVGSVNTSWMPVVWFVKDTYQGYWAGDVIQDASAGNTTDTERGMGRLVTMFSDPGDLILDPVCRHGAVAVAAISTHRRFIGLDASLDHIEDVEQQLSQIVWTEQVESGR
ncbi:MAG: ParB N-terminal domain-containing protein [Anaerolineae bacterium]|nr:ParB N-terminal domain-containing protein [Anaerolineae bacterium]